MRRQRRVEPGPLMGLPLEEKLQKIAEVFTSNLVKVGDG